MKSRSRQLNYSQDHVHQDPFLRNEIVTIREKYESPSHSMQRPRKVNFDRELCDLRAEVNCLKSEKAQKEKTLAKLMDENEQLFKVAVKWFEKYKKIKASKAIESQMENSQLNTQIKEAKEQIILYEKTIKMQRNQMTMLRDSSTPYSASRSSNKKSDESFPKYDNENKILSYQDLIIENQTLRKKLYDQNHSDSQYFTTAQDDESRRGGYQIQTDDSAKNHKNELDKLKSDYRLALEKIDELRRKLKTEEEIEQERQQQERMTNKYSKRKAQLKEHRQILVEKEKQLEQHQQSKHELEQELNECNLQLVQQKEHIEKLQSNLNQAQEKFEQLKIAMEQKEWSKQLKQIVIGVDNGIITKVQIKIPRLNKKPKLQVTFPLNEQALSMECDVNIKGQIEKLFINGKNGKIITYPDDGQFRGETVKFALDNIKSLEFMKDVILKDSRENMEYPQNMAAILGIEVKKPVLILPAKRSPQLSAQKKTPKNEAQLDSKIDAQDHGKQQKDQTSKLDDSQASPIRQIIAKTTYRITDITQPGLLVTDTTFIRGLVKQYQKNKTPVIINLKSLIVFSDSEKVFGIQGIYQLRQQKSKKSLLIQGGSIMKTLPAFDQRAIQIESTVEQQVKNFDLEDNNLEYVAIYKDSNGEIRSIQVKLSNTMLVYGNNISIDTLKQTYISFKMNQVIAVEMKYNEQSQNPTDLIMTNIRAINF